MLSKKIIIMPIKMQNIVIIPHILKCFVEFIIVLRFLFLCFWDISATIIFAADPESVKFPATKKRKRKKKKRNQKNEYNLLKKNDE